MPLRCRSWCAGRRNPPEVTLLLRAGFVLLLVASVFLVFLLDRDGLRDQIDGHVSVLGRLLLHDGHHHDGRLRRHRARSRTGRASSTRSSSRRCGSSSGSSFLGTAYQLVIQRLIEEWRMLRLQRELKDHVILCGYGHSGSIAAAGAA